PPDQAPDSTAASLPSYQKMRLPSLLPWDSRPLAEKLRAPDPSPPQCGLHCPIRSCPPQSPTALATIFLFRSILRALARCPPAYVRQKRARPPAQNSISSPQRGANPWSARGRRREKCSPVDQRTPTVRWSASSYPQGPRNRPT